MDGVSSQSAPNTPSVDVDIFDDVGEYSFEDSIHTPSTPKSEPETPVTPKPKIEQPKPKKELLPPPILPPPVPIPISPMNYPSVPPPYPIVTPPLPVPSPVLPYPPAYPLPPNFSAQQIVEMPPGKEKEKAIIESKIAGIIFKRKETDEREKDPSFISDSYSECYPGTFEGISYAAYDSEEEEDLTKMDSRKRLKRWDFEDDSKWEDYEANREALPKAAFQFGVKMKDGRKSKKSSDGKLKRQLRKIEGIIEGKEGGDKILGRGFEGTTEESTAITTTQTDSTEDPNSYASRFSQKRKTTGEETPVKKSRMELVQAPKTPRAGSVTPSRVDNNLTGLDSSLFK